MSFKLEQEHPLSKLRTSGLHNVQSFFDWQKGDTSKEMSIHFAAPKRKRTAGYLSGQIDRAVCQHCLLKTFTNNIKCSGVEVDDFNQVTADLTSTNGLSRDAWREVYRERTACKPTLVK